MGVWLDLCFLRCFWMIFLMKEFMWFWNCLNLYLIFVKLNFLIVGMKFLGLNVLMMWFKFVVIFMRFFSFFVLLVVVFLMFDGCSNFLFIINCEKMFLVNIFKWNFMFIVVLCGIVCNIWVNLFVWSCCVVFIFFEVVNCCWKIFWRSFEWDVMFENVRFVIWDVFEIILEI